jgi:hypothetical protein
VTFSTGKVTTRLVNREVIFRTRKVNSRNKSEETVVRLFERGFAGKGLASFHLDKTAPLGIALHNQITFHYGILSHTFSPLQVKSTLWYRQMGNVDSNGGCKNGGTT